MVTHSKVNSKEAERCQAIRIRHTWLLVSQESSIVQLTAEIALYNSCVSRDRCNCAWMKQDNVVTHRYADLLYRGMSCFVMLCHVEVCCLVSQYLSRCSMFFSSSLFSSEFLCLIWLYVDHICWQSAGPCPVGFPSLLHKQYMCVIGR